MASLLGLKHDQITRELLKRTYDSTFLKQRAKKNHFAMKAIIYFAAKKGINI